MNVLPKNKISEVKRLVLADEDERGIAATTGVSKGTVRRYRAETLREQLNNDTVEQQLAMYSNQIMLPENFKRPRYYNGMWLDTRRRWTEEDLRLLCAAADLRIGYVAAANTLGRAPSALVHMAVDYGIRVPRDWLALISKPKLRSVKPLNLNYPYIVTPDDRHADLIAVNRMISQAMPGREDVCQDIMLAIWESRTSLDELRTDPRALKAFVKAFRKASFERSGYAVESMDVTIHSEDGDEKSKCEDIRYQRTLADPDDQFIEGMIFGKRYAHDFADRTIAELSNEEESLGVPAAFWARIQPYATLSEVK